MKALIALLLVLVPAVCFGAQTKPDFYGYVVDAFAIAECPDLSKLDPAIHTDGQSVGNRFFRDAYNEIFYQISRVALPTEEIRPHWLIRFLEVVKRRGAGEIDYQVINLRPVYADPVVFQVVNHTKRVEVTLRPSSQAQVFVCRDVLLKETDSAHKQ